MKSQILRLAAVSWLLMATPGLARQIPPPQTDPAPSSDLLARREAILARERDRLALLPDPPAGGAAAAPADGSTRFVPLAEVVPARTKGPANGEAERARVEAALALFDLAGSAAKGPSPRFAFADECLRGVLDRQPDHAEARRLLGFLPRDGGWSTPYAAAQLAQGKILDPTFGWVRGDWVPHLRRGELPAPFPSTRWLPAAEADALRRDWDDGWDITTEHFAIHTNVPLSEAITFGRRLEDLHQLFFSILADVIGPDQLPLAQRNRVATLRPTLSKKPLHRVYYFANREEYARYLAPIQGEGSKKSLGTYVPKKDKQFGGISYFFNDVGGQLDVTSTLYHEASHQLLFESAGPDDYDRNVGNYWVFEGLGTFFETLQVEPDGSLRIGGLIGPRIGSARARLIGNREFIPIDLFVAMNPSQFQGQKGGGDIYLNYAEAMALAVFLMQSHEGRHREGFLEYARDAYRGRFRGGSGRTLEDRVGVRYRDLDRECLDYLAARGGHR